MVCYMVPIAALLVTAAARKLKGSHGSHGFWLAIMLLGASVFGVVDHLWNGELFLVGANRAYDLALGGTITAGVAAIWGILVLKHSIATSTQMTNRMGILEKQE